MNRAEDPYGQALLELGLEPLEDKPREEPEENEVTSVDDGQLSLLEIEHIQN